MLNFNKDAWNSYKAGFVGNMISGGITYGYTKWGASPEAVDGGKQIYAAFNFDIL